MSLVSLATASSRTARAVPSTILPRMANVTSYSGRRHSSGSPNTTSTNDYDDIIIHHMAEELSWYQQAPQRRSSSNGTTASSSTSSSKPSSKVSSTRVKTLSRASTADEYPTDGIYSYKNAKPAPARVLTTHEGELDDLLGCLNGPLGFDMEWKIARRGGTVPKTALIQICDKNMILLIQISSMARFPPKLKDLLESTDIAKMGVNVAGDARKLEKDFGIQMKGILELRDVAQCYDPDFHLSGRYTSLASIVAMYLGKMLPKGPVRISNWEARLNEDQMEYAASDAYAAWQVFNHLLEVGANREITTCFTTLLDGGSKTVTKRVKATKKTVESSPDILLTVTEEKKGPTPQQARAYNLWHLEQKPLDTICCELRSEMNPLKKGTVIGYIVNALKADQSLEFDPQSLRKLLYGDYPSYQRHKLWLSHQLAKQTTSMSSMTSSMVDVIEGLHAIEMDPTRCL